MEINIKKKLILREIFALANLFVEKEDNQDIKWLLKNYNNPKFFNEGQSQGFRNYLKKVLRLIDKNGKMTKEAKSIIKGNSNLFEPEHGLYKFSIVSYPFYEDSWIVNFDRIENKKTMDTSGNLELDNYKDFETKDHLIWDKKKCNSIRIEFIKSNNVRLPHYSSGGERRVNLQINSDLTQNTISFDVQGENLKYQGDFPAFDVQANLSYLFEEWDEKLGCLWVDFCDRMASDEKDSFRRNIIMDDVDIIFENEFDKGYTIEISNIPLLPRDEKNAIRWALYHFNKEYNKISLFISSEEIQKLNKRKFDKLPFAKVYPDVITSITEEKSYKNMISEEFIRRIAIADILQPMR